MFSASTIVIEIPRWFFNTLKLTSQVGYIRLSHQAAWATVRLSVKYLPSQLSHARLSDQAATALLRTIISSSGCTWRHYGINFRPFNRIFFNFILMVRKFELFDWIGKLMLLNIDKRCNLMIRTNLPLYWFYLRKIQMDT